MSIERLDHVNIRTSNLAALIEFYEQCIGLKNGSRPGFESTGAWLYLGDRDIVHLVESASAEPSKEPQLEHFALRATDYEAFTDNFKKHGVDYTSNDIDTISLRQIHVYDPDRNHVELNFSTANG
jgi:catechol 2,3-dioxygenase-like lactoylglutathione lyase family enzyme